MIGFLALRGFRNLHSGEWCFEPGVHLLLGGTGAGKTSVLEAIYLAATTRSFRVSRIADCVRQPVDYQQPGFRVALGALVPHRVDLELSWHPESGLDRRRNGVVAKLVEHVGCQPMIVCSSGDVSGLLDGPAPRRRQLDRGLIAERPGLLALFARYRRALEEKRAALVQRAPGGVLEALDAVIGPLAAEWTAARSGYVERWNAALRACGDASEPLCTRAIYRPSVESGDEAEWAEALLQARGEERRCGRILRGPHLDRVELFGGSAQRPVETLSAGERKTVALLLAAAQHRVLIEQGREAVVLLDDVDVELDRARFERLWPVLSEASQTLVSSNRPEAFPGSFVGTRWEISEGRVERL